MINYLSVMTEDETRHKVVERAEFTTGKRASRDLVYNTVSSKGIA